MVDVGVHLLRIEDGQLWLLCDRPHADYLAAWLLDASQRIEDR
jgi:sarcosine oxidase gamma subunit